MFPCTLIPLGPCLYLYHDLCHDLCHDLYHDLCPIELLLLVMNQGK
jgi:hypothetical protein